MVAERRIWRNLVGGVFSWLLAAIVGIELHAQPLYVSTAGYHNKVSTVPESQRVTEIRVRTALTHNLSQVDLSAAWTGQQRFQGSGVAGGAAAAFRKSSKK